MSLRTYRLMARPTGDQRLDFDRMFTIFHVFALGGLVGGALLGLNVGSGYVGLLVGKMPFVLVMRSLWRMLRRDTVTQLHERMEKEYDLSHLIIMELVRRGEPIESCREVVERQRASPSADVRRFGEANWRVCFADEERASSK